MNFIKIKVKFQTLFSWGLFGIVLLMIGAFLGFIALPWLIDRRIWESKILKEGTDQWKAFLNMPFSFDFKVYLFEIENPKDIYSREKPVMKETGPYVYKLSRVKKNVTWNYTSDEISYIEHGTLLFDQEASGELSDTDRVTVLNIPLINLLYKAEQNVPELMGTVDIALGDIFRKHRGLLLGNVTVKNLLFDGIQMCRNGCKKCGFVSVMICEMIKKEIRTTKQMRIEGNDLLFASLHYVAYANLPILTSHKITTCSMEIQIQKTFYSKNQIMKFIIKLYTYISKWHFQKNDTSYGYFTVKSGQTNKLETGYLTRYNNRSNMTIWQKDDYNCNKIEGVTSVFPNSVNNSSRFISFSNDICRKMELVYSNTEEVEGIKGYKYVARKTTFNNSLVENKCYCINTTKNFDAESECLYDGVLDLAKCTDTDLNE